MTFLTKVEVIEMSEKSATKIAGEVQVASEDCLGQPLPRAAYVHAVIFLHFFPFRLFVQPANHSPQKTRRFMTL